MKQRWSLAVGIVVVLIAFALWRACSNSRPVEPIAPSPQAVAAEPVSAPRELGTSAEETARESAIRPAQSHDEANAIEHIVVRVADVEGHPISTAHVEIVVDDQKMRLEVDADGLARAPCEPDEHKSVPISVDAEGYFHVRATYRRSPEIQISLARVGRMRGRVLEKGILRTIANARIEHLHSTCKGCAPECALSNTDGSYELGGVPIGSDQSFLVTVDGLPPAWSVYRLDGTAAVAEHDFFVDPGVEITGDVVDFTDGAAIFGAVIENQGIVLARTSSDGRFTLRAAASPFSGRIDLRFGATDHCWLRRDLTPQEFEATSPLHVRLPRGARIEGLVSEADGSPARALDVRVRVDAAAYFQAIARRELGELTELLSEWRIEAESHEILVHTDDTGRFRMSGLVPFSPQITLWSEPSARGRLQASTGPLGSPGETLNVRVQLLREACGSIAGRVLQNGVPVPGSVRWTGPTRSGSADTDDHGRFLLEFVETGRIVVSTTREVSGANRFITHEDVVTVAADARVERDFDLIVSMKRVSGRVVRVDGGPVYGTHVVFQETPVRADGTHQLTNTDAQGRFEVELPDVGCKYRASTYFREKLFQRDGISPGDRDVEIVIGDVASVLCRALDAQTHEPIPGIDVFARASGAERFQLVSDPITHLRAEGWKELQLNGGVFEFYCQAPGLNYAPCTRAATIVAAIGETRIELEMTRGSSVEFRLAPGLKHWDPSNRVLLLDAEIVESIEKLGTPPKQLADANPRFPGIDPALDRDVDLIRDDVTVVRGLAPGRYRLYAPQLALDFEPVDVEVRSNCTTSVVLRWRSK